MEETRSSQDVQAMDDAEAEGIVGGTGTGSVCVCGCDTTNGGDHTGGCEITHGHYTG
ncbi:hypothetical protein [Candidatus Palauibacter sp.]|uniref:hypothetical protein n=1 Tax=Candidatus Palauibacter sp. TaxID=3101350 RepID=UPI003AF26463